MHLSNVHNIHAQTRKFNQIRLQHLGARAHRSFVGQATATNEDVVDDDDAAQMSLTMLCTLLQAFGVPFVAEAVQLLIIPDEVELP